MVSLLRSLKLYQVARLYKHFAPNGATVAAGHSCDAKRQNGSTLLAELLMPQKHVRVSRLKEHQPDFLQLQICREKVFNGSRRNLGGLVRWIPIDAGRDSWESNGRQIAFHSQHQRVVITIREQFGFPSVLFAKDGPDRVNDIERGQLPARRDDGFARRQSLRESGAANLAARFQDLGTTGEVNRTVNSATTQQRRVRGIHYRLDILFGDVAGDDRDAAIEKLPYV